MFTDWTGLHSAWTQSHWAPLGQIGPASEVLGDAAKFHCTTEWDVERAMAIHSYGCPAQISGEEKRSLASWNVMTAYSNDNHVGAAWFLNPTLSLMRLHQDMPDCAGHNPDTKHLGGADLARSWPDDIPPGTQPPRCPMSIGPHTTERPTLTQTHSKVGAQSPALLLL